MSERQTMQRWVISVCGVEQARVSPGQSFEIGRKPIRPLRDDGYERIDIVDNKRSMSKRHAVFTVDDSAVASLRDLNSTNGSYLVGSNGDLLRLDANVDFQFPDTIMHMQFGDVPIDFERVEENVEEDSTPVRDLFSYASDAARLEHDVEDLSVNDILDVRAGEPTGIFKAQSIANPNISWDTKQYRQEQAEDSELVADQQEQSLASAQVALPVMREIQEPSLEPRNLFTDAQQVVQNVEENPESSLQKQETSHDEQNIAEHRDEQASYALGEQVCGQTIDTDQADDFVSETLNNASHMTTEHGTLLTNGDEVSSVADAAYTSAFEPGSVFEKVSQGEFDRQQSIVQVGGFTSQDAQHTTDFSQQFAIAKYAELLPFLAMNTNLYDDLYAWLAAQGNQEVDDALARNDGYQAYRNAVGK